MKLYQKLSVLAFYITILLLTVYSYVLIDPNLTLLNSKIFEQLRNFFVQFGYYQRELSSSFFVLLVSLLFLLHWQLVKNYQAINLKTLLISLGTLMIVSYPWLSHDFFNYLFDAKIVTFYHENPYFLRALDFPRDPWLRFMQWTHRTYPYGPVFLILTLIPSFLSFGKFLLDFLLFKLLFFALFATSIFYLAKINKKWAIFILTNPLIIIEGLVNAHNDIVALSLALIGFYWLQKSNLTGKVFFILSAGIKYLTLPVVFFVKQKDNLFNLFAAGGLIIVLVYLSLWQEIQPWYFLSLFILVPYYEKWIARLNLFFAGLLFSYYPYIRFGGWDKSWKVSLKHEIIIAFFAANVVYLLVNRFFTKAKA